MPARNSLREYHLLVVRGDGGFIWEIRFDRHAKPVRASSERYASHDAAREAGETALAELKASLTSHG